MSRSKECADYVIGVIKASPEETRRGWELLAWKAFEKSLDMRRAFFSATMASFWRQHRAETRGPGELVVLKTTRRRAASRRRVARTGRAQERKVIALSLFKWTMQQTCGHLKTLGGIYASFAKCGKPNQVLGDVVSTLQARDIFRRHGMDVKLAPVEDAKGAKRAA